MISVSTLQQNNKVIYVGGTFHVDRLGLLMDYIPALAPFSHWVTPQ